MSRRLATALLLSAALSAPALAQQDPGWVGKDTAKLQALDKVTARVTVLDVPLNKPFRFGTLQILVRACEARPPDEVPDAAAWLQVMETRQNPDGVAIFQGWMFANAPGVSMLEHPVYDLRVLECH